MQKIRVLKLSILLATTLLSCSMAQAQTNPGKLIYADEAGRIKVINADGTGETKLTIGENIIDDDPVYSPDGSKIAFTRRTGLTAGVCVMNADGTNVVTVIPNGGSETHNFDPSWSPDGAKLAFASNRSGPPGRIEIWISNADGTGLVRLTTSVQLGADGQGPIFSSDIDPAWAPDGSKIAFVSTRDGLSDRELYIMNPDGSSPLRLTSDSLDDHMPAWSPDSQRIAFTKSNGTGIHIINRDGTNLVFVVSFSSWPAWSPDGSKLAFVQSDASLNFKGAVFISKTDGTDKVRVTSSPDGARAPSWAPSSSPPIPTFKISGQVKDTSGAPLSGVSLTLFVIPLRTTQSDSAGAYSFTGLPAGTYPVQISKTGYGFTPTSTTITITNSDQTANFTGFVAFSISGQVTGAGSGLPVTLSGSESRSTFTELHGTYSFNVLPAGGNYTVSINTPFFIVTPPSISFNNLQANQTANFNAVIATYTISGTTRRLGLPKSGINVRLRDVVSGNEPRATTSDANGHYEFTNVTAGRMYSVEPASANYLGESKGFAALDGDKIVDFDLRSANNLILSRATFTVIEGVPSLQVRVFRGGNAAGVGPITVNYATADGTATGGSDYTAVSGTLDFPEGTFFKDITIPILSDQVVEGSEQFSIVLSNPTGEVDLASPSSAVVTITEMRLLTESNSDRAIALNTATLVAEPFTLTTETNFGDDHRTRISLFVEDMRGFQTFPSIVIEAVDVQQNHILLPLEAVAFYTIFPFQQLIVRLPENLNTPLLFVTVRVNGSSTNTARISIKQ